MNRKKKEKKYRTEHGTVSFVYPLFFLCEPLFSLLLFSPRDLPPLGDLDLDLLLVLFLEGRAVSHISHALRSPSLEKVHLGQSHDGIFYVIILSSSIDLQVWFVSVVSFKSRQNDATLIPWLSI